MRSNVTAKIKIIATPEIIATVSAYVKCLQYCVNQAWKHKIKNNVKLHPFVYKSLRRRLPSQLAISCIKQACGVIKKAKTKPVIRKASVKFNFPRNANFKEGKLTLRLLKIRQSFDIVIPSCYKQYFNDWKLCESFLRIDRQGRCFFLFTFSKEINANDITSQFVLGIDFGVNNLAVTSDNSFYNSAKVKQIKRKFRYLRSKLQAKGTRSCTKLLKKLSGRETRWMTWINHNISKDIVSKFNGNKIVMENLKGIRKQNHGKRMNYWINNWSFYQLQKFVQYKAEMKGIGVIRVNPAYTSQICHKCGYLGFRLHGCFNCFHCNLHSYNADLNAARNLSSPMLEKRQGDVNHPYSTCNDNKASMMNCVGTQLKATLGCNPKASQTSVCNVTSTQQR